ncbi:MAG TPA: bifunctional DNA-formamidopyrimidine glycosylase/DNA-(apurinic or apyrimidinic site) lyase, partial [Candidatus Binatia bacterium]|nr:bifunctional DNA-formamidopyrimidine glycosylase/DNA-(apurinic or apyrimidinic site) lyase [Candidatus Binatia bacterium]
LSAVEGLLRVFQQPASAQNRMPELPEVETICRGLRSHLEGRRILRVTVRERRLRCLVDRKLAWHLEGKTIVRVGRIAKYILIALSGDIVWLIHLGMSGKLVHVTPDTPKQKHDHILVSLDTGGELRYHDPRRFGISMVVAGNELDDVPQLKHLGLDPFDGRFTSSYLHAFTKRSDRRIRDLLLDQQIVAGIGNIYANEILARVGVRPTARARKLKRAKVEAIAAMIPEVLKEAIRWCGTSFSDYRDADDKFGEFQNHLRVYDRDGEKCRLCPSPIRRVAIGNRSAFYCPSCQK